MLVSLPILASGEVVLVVGDSLSAAYNMPLQDGWVSILQQRLDSEAPGRYRVINASISGDTTASGVVRVPPLLAEHEPDLVVLELGANDGLRGLPLAQMRENLQQIIDLAEAGSAEVILVNVELPRSYGKYFNQKFQQVFRKLQAENDLPLVTLGFSKLNDVNLLQADGLHPTAAAQPLIVDLMLPLIKQATGQEQAVGGQLPLEKGIAGGG